MKPNFCNAKNNPEIFNFFQTKKYNKKIMLQKNLFIAFSTEKK